MTDRTAPIPLGWQGSGPDFEVYRDGNGWLWTAYDEDILIGTGRARTRLSLAVQLRRFKRKEQGR